MADIIPNRSLGQSYTSIKSVEDNSPAAAVLRIHAWVVTASDNDIRDMGSGSTPPTVSTLEAVTNVAEATNTGYANISMDDADIAITVDDANDRIDVALTDQTFSAVSAGDNWNDVSLSYDDDGTDTDSNSIVLHTLDFAVTPNGGDITGQSLRARLTQE